MWLPVSVRHDESFLRVTERPLIEHLADKLNEIEQENGDIIAVTVVQHVEDKCAELLVKVKDGTE